MFWTWYDTLLFYLALCNLAMVFVCTGLLAYTGRLIKFLRDLPLPTGPLPKVSIIVPARNEERNIAEALTSLEDFKKFTDAIDVPVLANMTEFGKTPLLTTAQLHDAGIALALYPLSAFRAMSKAALDVYQTIAREGTQAGVVKTMQTREELYAMLGYHELERQLDARIKSGKEQNRGR